MCGGGEKRILFLAREGWFLKKCFDLYQEMRIPAAKRIKTEYLKCSRRAIHSVQEELCKTDFFALDITVRNYFKSIGFSEEEIERLPIGEDIELDVLVKDFSTSAEAEKINDNPELTAIRKKRLNENQNAFKAYFEEKAAGKEVVIVDVGWSGRMQQGITRLFPDVKIYGFYLGIMNQLSSEPKVQRQGLIFNRDEDGRKSRYFDVLRINTQLYEQLLAAPHGSACFYRSEAGGKTVVIEEWAENEKAVYEKHFFDLQNVMEKIFRMCCTYSFDPLLKQESRKLARIILRAGLLQSKKRLKFVKEITGGFSQNFQQQSSGLKYNVGDAKIKLSELLLHPDRYARYACKVSQVLDGKGGGSIGRMLMFFFYFYTRLVCRI